MMVDQVIGSILEAEARADEIVKEANFRAKADLSAADEQAENIRENAIDASKKLRKEKLKQAETAAQARYLELMKEGNAQAEAVKTAARPRIEESAENIAKKVVEQWR